jgi:hypothetical protein
MKIFANENLFEPIVVVDILGLTQAVRDDRKSKKNHLKFTPSLQ